MHESFGSPPAEVLALMRELEGGSVTIDGEEVDAETELAPYKDSAYAYSASEKERFTDFYLAAVDIGIYPGFSDPEDWADPIPQLDDLGNIIELTEQAREQAAEAVGRISAEHDAKHGLRHHPWCGVCHTNLAEINAGSVIAWDAPPVVFRSGYTAQARAIGAYVPTEFEDAREQLVLRCAAYLAVSPEPTDTYNPEADTADLSADDNDAAWEKMKRHSAQQQAQQSLSKATNGEITRGDLWQLEAPTGERLEVESAQTFDVTDEFRIEDEVRKLAVRAEARRRYEAEDAPDPSTFDDAYLDLSQLDGLPTPEPLIEGILARHTYSLLRGRDGTYKSFVALDWALCLAAGKAWQGREAQQERVLYIAGEGAFGIAARVRAWSTAWQTEIDPARFTLRTASVNMLKGGPEFEDLLLRITAGGYGLVVVDTLRRASGSADENSSEMGTVIDNLDRVKRATNNGSVLVITHTQKQDDDSRGFSGIEDDADTVWHCKRDAESQALTVTNKKMKDGPDGTRFDLQAKPVGDSLILSAGVADAFAGTRPSEEKILNVLADTFALTDGATAKEIMTATGISESGFYKARGELLKQGKMDSTKVGGGVRYKIHDSTGTPQPLQASDLQDSTDST